MKMFMRTGATLLLATASVLALVGCPQPEPLSSDANLASITIAGKAPQSLGTPHTKWLDVVPGDIYLADEDLTGAQVQVSVSDGSEVWFARSTLGAPPSFDKTTSYDLVHDDVVWIELFSANLDRFQLYAFRIHKITPLLAEVNLLKEAAFPVAFGSGSIFYAFNRNAVKLGTPKASIAEIDDPGELLVGTSEFAGINLPGATSTAYTIESVPEILDTGIRMAVAMGSAAPDFASTPSDLLTLVAGDFLYIECKSGQGDNEVLFYKIKLVEMNDDMSIIATINDQPLTTGAMGYHSWAGSEYYSFLYGDAGYRLGAKMADNDGSVYSTADTAETIDLVITPAVPANVTKIEYAHIDSESRYAAENRLEYGASGNFGNIPDGEWIAVKLTNQLGDIGWYRFQISKGE